MRIILVNKFWYKRGGAEQVVLQTRDLLLAAGHEVAIFGMRHPDNELDSPFFIDPVNTTQPGWNDIKNIFYNKEAKKKFSQLLLEFKPDVVHFHNIYYQLSFSVVDAALEKKIPCVFTLHDFHWLSPNYRLFGRDKLFVPSRFPSLQALFHASCKEIRKMALQSLEYFFRARHHYEQRVSVFIFSCQFSLDLHKRFFSLPPKSKLIFYPVNIQNHPYQSGDYILYLGRLSEEKGLDLLLRVAEKTPSIPYIIAGTGDEEVVLKKYVTDHNLSNVTFVGAVHGNVRDTTIAQARIVVVPSQWFENPSLIVSEAAAFAKMVLGSEIGGLTEELLPECRIPLGNISLWVESITKWFNCSEDERKKQGEILQQKLSERHNPADYIQRVIDVYKSVV